MSRPIFKPVSTRVRGAGDEETSTVGIRMGTYLGNVVSGVRTVAVGPGWESATYSTSEGLVPRVRSEEPYNRRREIVICSWDAMYCIDLIRDRAESPNSSLPLQCGRSQCCRPSFLSQTVSSLQSRINSKPFSFPQRSPHCNYQDLR